MSSPKTTQTPATVQLPPPGWRETTLGEVVKIGRGSSPRPIRDYLISRPGIPRVKIADATSSPGRFITETKEFIREGGRSTSVNIGDLIVSNSATPGIPKFMGIDACVHDGWLVFSQYNDLYKLYLYYFFLDYRVRLEHSASGTVFKNLTTSILRSVPISLPPLPEQQAIAGVLSAFDDKIELLRQQNQTLEKLGQTIFHERFGRYSPDRPDELPEGRRVGKLGEEFDITIGRTPPRKESQRFSDTPTGKKWISIKDIGNTGVYIFDTSEYLTDEAIEKYNIPVIPENTTILSFKMTVGKLSITTEEMLSNEAIAHLKVMDKSILNSKFIYLYLQSLDFNSLGSTSSIVTAINSTIIRNLDIIIPDKKMLEQFDEVVQPIFSKIRENTEQIQSLSRSRDALLPKLMRGKVRVSF